MNKQDMEALQGILNQQTTGILKAVDEKISTAMNVNPFNDGIEPPSPKLVRERTEVTEKIEGIMAEALAKKSVKKVAKKKDTTKPVSIPTTPVQEVDCEYSKGDGYHYLTIRIPETITPDYMSSGKKPAKKVSIKASDEFQFFGTAYVGQAQQ